LAHTIIEAQQSEADDRGTRNEQRCEVDGIECPNRITGKRPARAVNDLARNSQNLPMSSSLGEVRSTVGSFGLRQFLERRRPQQYAITLDKRQVGRDD
jgi:transposase InsO family protein